MLLITPLSEVIRDDSILVGSVNVCEVAKRRLSPNCYAKWINRRYGWQQLDIRVRRACTDYFDQEVRRQLSKVEFAFFTRVVGLQRVNSDRFRVYGRMSQNRGKIWLTTEFQAFTDDKEAWREIRGVARRLSGSVRRLYSGKHVSQYWPPKLVPGERYITDAKGQHWAAGPDDGRHAEQVEVRWDVSRENLTQVRRMVDVFSEASGEAWRRFGVSVI